MQGPTCRWRRALHVFLVVVAAALLLFLGSSGRGLLRRSEREAVQDAVITHFERASWFALQVDEYEQYCPGLNQEFREMAEWHARRAKEYQRMDPSGLTAEQELDAAHDRQEGRLMDRALKAKMQRGR